MDRPVQLCPLKRLLMKPLHANFKLPTIIITNDTFLGMRTCPMPDIRRESPRLPKISWTPTTERASASAAYKSYDAVKYVEVIDELVRGAKYYNNLK